MPMIAEVYSILCIICKFPTCMKYTDDLLKLHTAWNILYPIMQCTALNLLPVYCDCYDLLFDQAMTDYAKNNFIWKPLTELNMQSYVTMLEAFIRECIIVHNCKIIVQ